MLPERFFSEARLAIVAAHPDDETIGAALVLSRTPEAHVLHVTDGAPGNLRFAAAAGCDSRESYAEMRSRELSCALALAGIPADHAQTFGVVDQEVSAHLVDLVRLMLERFLSWRLTAVLTHPYEGGHPDHDSTALAVHAACTLLPEPPSMFEFTSYHARDGEMITGDFLPSGSGSGFSFPLSPEEQDLKRRMLECFASQREMLSQFPVEEERFRPAPRYDFTQPPHEGELHYERFDWGSTGTRWRELAERALKQFGLREPI